MILHITDDLMMSSTARSYAKNNDVSIKFANSFPHALTELENGDYDTCFADLQATGMDVNQLAAAVKSKQVKTIAYVQHVSVEMLAMAKELDFAQVMTRGQFHKSVGELISAAS